MTFQSAGHRARTQQRVRLGATPEGKLASLMHDYVYERSMLDDYHENCGEATAFQYSVPNLRVKFGRAKRNIGSPSDMRGPGAVPGLYATESAMNELADQLKIDPVKLRVLNEPKIDEGLGIPFSSRHYLECLQLGAEKFGWSKRNPEIGAMKRDELILGWGMAAARRTSAPERTRFSRSLAQIRRVYRSTKSKWRLAIHRFPKVRLLAVQWRPHR
jgi:xanthine dehydrogenase YagR molybdenum-binding subunit